MNYNRTNGEEKEKSIYTPPVVKGTLVSFDVFLSHVQIQMKACQMKDNKQ